MLINIKKLIKFTLHSTTIKYSNFYKNKYKLFLGKNNNCYIFSLDYILLNLELIYLFLTINLVLNKPNILFVSNGLEFNKLIRYLGLKFNVSYLLYNQYNPSNFSNKIQYNYSKINLNSAIKLPNIVIIICKNTKNSLFLELKKLNIPMIGFIIPKSNTKNYINYKFYLSQGKYLKIFFYFFYSYISKILKFV
jgi:ribosomal protein S2